MPASSAIDPTVTDVLIPAAAIFVSTAIALIVVGMQLRGAKKQRRSEAIGRVVESISHVIADASRQRNGETVDLEPAMSQFDALIIQLALALPRRERIAATVIRDRLFMEFVSSEPAMEAAAWALRTEVEQWALGRIPIRDFRRFAAWWGSRGVRLRYLTHSWHVLLIENDNRSKRDRISAVDRARIARLAARHEPWFDRLNDRWFTWRYRR